MHVFANLSHPHVSARLPAFYVTNTLNFKHEAVHRITGAQTSLEDYPISLVISQEAVKINAFTGPSGAGARSPRVNGPERQIITTINAQQIPPSPSVQQSPVTQATPSTVETSRSPLQTPGPLIANANGSVEATSRRQETTRMRSSIACSRCRRSKTKCDNNGVRDITGALAPCKSCVASKKICDYPAPQPAAASNYSQRRESTVTTAGEEVSSVIPAPSTVIFITFVPVRMLSLVCKYPNGAPMRSNLIIRWSLLVLDKRKRMLLCHDNNTDGNSQAPPKKRKRPIVPTAGTMFRSKGRLGALEDALESPLLTPRVWDELVSQRFRKTVILLILASGLFTKNTTRRNFHSCIREHSLVLCKGCHQFHLQRKDLILKGNEVMTLH